MINYRYLNNAFNPPNSLGQDNYTRIITMLLADLLPHLLVGDIVVLG
jgi:hypothetical protein